MTDISPQVDRRLSTLLNRLDRTAIWTVSEQGEFDYISDGFDEIWGISADEIQRNPERLIETIHPDDREFIHSQMEQSGEEVFDTECEGRIVRPDGEIRWLKNQQVPVRDKSGNFSYIIGISTDITEQKRREQELYVLNRILRHDIRNDMAVILGWMEMLEDHVDEDGQEYLRKTLSSGEHIVELTDLAREYVELVVKGDDMNVKPLSLDSILRPEIDARREMFPEAKFVIDSDIPNIELLTNELLSSVFRNLLNNAVQHHDKKEPEIYISVDVHEKDVIVHIVDNGPGIPADQKESIFDDQNKGIDSSGTGVGLYLTQTLVTNLGGDIWIEDNEPNGSIFNIRLPRVDTTPITQ
ncbi:PAS domain S-box protein [Haloferax sp. AS1]|uniref:PAS domain-containing sensor histidine kinase n=1 Tax=Haloferax sp. AS1 TaxID=2562277 RepID=UPI00165EF6BF|nr:PAS domain-containing sensor histidine kinase [Haloferax sp. AS1]MBC9987963.1 PAS domain S-box protein [Haloferax sp. AS1]